MLKKNKLTFRALFLHQVAALATTCRIQPVDGDTAAHGVDGFAEESGILDGAFRNMEDGGVAAVDVILQKNKLCVEDNK